MGQSTVRFHFTFEILDLWNGMEMFSSLLITKKNAINCMCACARRIPLSGFKTIFWPNQHSLWNFPKIYWINGIRISKSSYKDVIIYHKNFVKMGWRLSRHARCQNAWGHRWKMNYVVYSSFFKLLIIYPLKMLHFLKNGVYTNEAPHLW